MKKWILTLCLIFGLTTLSACVEKDYGPVTEEAETYLNSQAEDTFNVCFLDVAEKQNFDEMYEYYLEDEQNEMMANAMLAWKQLQPELGTFQEIKSTEITTIDGGYDVELVVSYEKRDLDVTMLSDKKMTKWTSIALEGEYTFGEKMEKAALNTLLGMGTVFIVLVLIIGVISCFKFINKFQAAREKKAAAAAPAVTPAPAAPAPVEEVEEEEDDLALIAVITAAIAASENTSPDGLIVRSIRRAGKSNWKNS